MSSNTMESLPVEILHRIFDNLDAQTILLSVRLVCRQLRAVVSTYNRYAFDFKSISKSSFHLLCRLINPQNVISLTLHDNEHAPDQIALFISLVRLRQMTRLRSLTFLGIEEFQLNMILKRIHLNSLSLFSLNIQNYDDRRKKTTLHFLSSIMAQSSIRKVELNIKSNRVSNISWPLTSKIECLTINEDITLEDLSKILFCSPQLHTLIVKQSLIKMINHVILKSTFPQITSLILEKVDVTIVRLESFLLLTPSLSYLKLISEGSIFNGNRWEQFIQINLPHLDNFQFFIDTPTQNNQTREELELIIESFRSPFWIENKKWFVAAEFCPARSYRIQVYSIPMCKSVLQYELNSRKVFVSNSTISSYNDPSVINNINEIILSLKILTNDDIKQELGRNNPLFPKVTKLQLDVDRRTPLNSLKYLPSIIDVSQLVEVKLESFHFHKDNKKLLLDVITLIERSCNLTSLIIHSRYCKYGLYPFLNELCSIIPRQIKHLQIPINQLDQMKIILERCQYLSIVRFDITRFKFTEEVVRWFSENTVDSTVLRHSGCTIIWIGKKTNEIPISYKRIKLTEDNQFDS